MAPRKKAAQPQGYTVPPQTPSTRGVQLPPPPAMVMARAPARQAMRPEPRSGEVRGRDGTILTRNNRTNEAADQFDIPLHYREAGWDMQWVTISVYGKDQPQNVHSHHENGWRSVPSSRMPGHFHPVEYTGAIIRDDMMLMERPMVLTEQALFDGVQAAKRQRRTQSSAFTDAGKMLAETHGDTAGFETPDERTASRAKDRPFLRRSVEQAPVSSYPSRSLAVGDEV